MKYVLEELVPMAADILRAEDSHEPVMIVAPTGSGKQHIAGTIADQAGFTSDRVLYQNCAAIPKELMESELFGHEKGSFTGAVANQKGILESDETKLVILDEINSLPRYLQAKLLTFLDSGIYRRLGNRTNNESKVKILGMSNADMQRRPFREDFYFRFRVIPVPPLYKRRTDILVFLREWCPNILWKRKDIMRLLSYNWPGNVRELKRFADLVNWNCYAITSSYDYTMGVLQWFEEHMFYQFEIKSESYFAGVPDYASLEILYDGLNQPRFNLFPAIQKYCPLICPRQPDDLVDLSEITDLRVFNTTGEFHLAKLKQKGHILSGWKMDWETWCSLFHQDSESEDDVLTNIIERKWPKLNWKTARSRGLINVSQVEALDFYELTASVQYALDNPPIRAMTPDEVEKLKNRPPSTTPQQSETTIPDEVHSRFNPEDYKDQWIRQLLDQGAQPADVARTYGLNRKTVAQWFRQHKKRNAS